MTGEELARHDGREGRRAFAAVNGRVYDFTESPLWHGGSHENRHRAGCDLTAELKSAPHVRAVIERFPVVGTLDAQEPLRRRTSLPLILFAVSLLLLLLLFLLLR